MPYTREPVRLVGFLRGNNLRAECTVSATRVTLVGTKLTKDCMYSIDWVSTSLPPGEYQLSIEGKIIDVRHSKDGWRVVLATSPAVQDTRKVKDARL